MYKKFFTYNVFIFFLVLFISGPVTAQTKKPVKKSPVKKTIVKPAKDKIPVITSGPQRVKLTTDSGTMIIKLYDSTPLHRDNFLKLAKQGFYDSLLFHRVIPQFMIQGGDPTSKNAAPGTLLGGGGGEMERIPAEFKPHLFHKKGVLAAARNENPTKASSAAQFYIVHGKVWNDTELNMFETRTGKKYTEEQRNIYKTLGGTPMLDQGYTVFGEVESGLEVIGKIALVQRDSNNRPLVDIRMKMELIK